MVNPDHVAAGEGDGVTSPDVLGVEFLQRSMSVPVAFFSIAYVGVAYGDVDVLDNDVGHAVGDSETLSTDDTGTTDSDNGPVGCQYHLPGTGKRGDPVLVALDINVPGTGHIVGDRDSRVPTTSAPIRAIDGVLATGVGAGVTGWTAAWLHTING